MPSRSSRGDRADEGWVRPYDPHRDVGDWSTRPPPSRGQHNYGFDREQDVYNGQYYNRPYYISSNGHDDGQSHWTGSRHPSSSMPARHAPIPKSKQKSCIYWALTLFSVLAVLLLVALAIFVVLYVLDLQKNNSTTPTVIPTRLPGVTTQAPTTGFVTVIVAMKLMQPFLPQYNDALSPEYMALENSFIRSMNNIFLLSDLRNSYEGTTVNGFSPGSIDVIATLFFNRDVILQTPTANPNDGTSLESRIGVIVQVTITVAVEGGSCCQELQIIVTTVGITQVTIRISPTLVPTNRPTTLSQSTSTTRPETTVSDMVPPTTPVPDPAATTETAVNPSTTPSPDPIATTAELPAVPTTPIATTTVPDPAATTETAVNPSTTPSPDPIATTAELPAVPTTPIAMTTVPDPAATTETAVNPSTTPTPDFVPTTAEVPETPSTPVAMTTEESVALTTEEDAMTTIITTTLSPATSTEMTTEEATTIKPGTLNPPECGMSTQPPPSPTDDPLTARGTWPWLGSLRLRTGHGCGVTLLSPQWAVTSASCLRGGGTFISLVFGDITSSYSQSDVHVERAIERVYPHPGFNLVTYDNDIAVIKMAEPVEYSDGVGPVCLQPDDQAGGGGSQTYSNCYVAGWSSLSVLEDRLQSVPVSTVSDGPCQGSGLFLDLTDKFICAQFANADACIGDSGGGLVCQNSTTGAWTLVGITDLATEDCLMTTFTKVSNYWDVVNSVIDGDSEIPCDPIQVPQCTSVLSYSSTYPTTQSAVADLMSTAQSSGLLTCHSDISAVLCATLMPECRSNGTGLTLCQQTCSDVSSSCATLLNQLAFDLDCRIYPLGIASPSGLCESGEDYSCGNRSLSLSTTFDYLTLSSPNHPSAYPGYDDCIWIISAPQDSHIVIKFQSLGIESCCDTLTIGEGRDPGNRTSVHELVYGNTLPLPIVIPSSVVWLRFQSDRTEQETGFQAEIQAVGNTGLASFCSEPSTFRCSDGMSCIPFRWRCDGIRDCVLRDDESCQDVYQDITLDIDGSQQITSPGYHTGGYDSYATYTYVINTVPGRKLIINFDGFNTENGFDFFEAGDGLVPDNTSTVFFQWSGGILPPVLLSDGNEMWIQFKSDGGINHLGFDLFVFDVDGSESFDCGSSEFDCGHSVCISASWQCDETTDCVFGSDEAGCVPLSNGSTISPAPETTTELSSLCTDEEFQCDGVLCISQNAVCNQILDCADSTDEVLRSYCPVVCGPQSIEVPLQGSVNLTAPTVLPNLQPSFYKGCGYIVVAPANHLVYLRIHRANVYPVEQKVILAFGPGQGQVIEFTESIVEQPLDLLSLGQMIRIVMYGTKWTEEYGINFEFWATNDTDIGVCNNNFQVLPTEKTCDQKHDCMDFTDEINCLPQCGQTNYTMDYNVSVTLQLTNFPTVYDNNMACLWLITGLANASIIFQTNVVDIASGDSITFGQGHDINAPLSMVAVVPGILPTGSHILVPGSQAYAFFLTDSEGVGSGFIISVRVLYDTDFIRCNNLVQVVFQEDLCDGVAQCEGDPTDEINCDACLSIPIANCTNLLPYSTTQYPSRYATDSSAAVAQYQQARDNFCQPQSELVLCSLLFPECPAAGSSRQAICQSVCEGAVSDCDFNAGICDTLPQTGGQLWCNYDNDILETGICGTAPLAPSPFTRIVNGENAVLGEWPWTLAILDEDYGFRCGATLINPQWAITAAHCADIIHSILAGFIDLTSLGPYYKLVAVSEIYTHPFYDANDQVNQQNDIALMKLETPLEFNDYIRPACINTEQNELEIYTKCYATGWGALSESNTAFPDILQEVLLPLVSQENCSMALEDDFAINHNMICAGYEEGGRDSCQGDSGGPLVCEGSDGRWNLVGATSFGLGCARPGKPGVYARISQYIDFIEYHIKQDMPPPQQVI